MSLSAIKPYAKAVAAFVVPTAGSLVGAMQDVSPAGSAISGAEWITAILVGITTSGFVYGTPNRDPRALHQDESVQPPSAPQPFGHWDGIRKPGPDHGQV